MEKISEIVVSPDFTNARSETKKYNCSFVYCGGLKCSDITMIHKNGYYDFEYPNKMDKSGKVRPIWYITDFVFKDEVEQKIIAYWESVLEKMKSRRND